MSDRAGGNVAVRCNKCFAEKCGDALAAVMRAEGCDFPAALRLVGRYLGVPPVEPKASKAGKSIDDRIDFDAATNRGAVEAWAGRKPGVSADAAFRAGVRTGFYPPSGSDKVFVVALPATMPPSGKSIARTVLRVDGQPLAGSGGKPAKSINVKGSKDAWIVAGSADELAAAETLVKLGGPTDLLAVAAILPPGTVGITNACGAKARRVPVTLAAGKRVVVIGDADEPGQDGMFGFADRFAAVAESVTTIRLPYEVKPDHGQDVRDFIVAGGTWADLEALATPYEALNAPDDRPVVEITADEHEVNAKALAALAFDADLYQRGGLLVRVVLDDTTAGGVERPDPTPRIVCVPEALLRERLAATCRFVQTVERGESVSTEQKHPPTWTVKAIDQRGDYPGLRTLRAVSPTPILRPDGTLVTRPGYDAATRTLYLPTGPQPTVPPNPTRDDALAAVALLADMVADFPFQRPEHRSAWIALLLTVVARPAFAGPAPAAAIDGNTRGVGKGLLAAATGTVTIGGAIPVTSPPEHDAEARKRITAIAISGDPVVMFDNVAGNFGGPAIDAALTATVWRDRILGRSEMSELPLLVTWIITGNNIVFGADTGRRILRIRLQTPDERPEERSGFRHPDLLAHVRQNRPALLGAALTILRAWFVAGRPAKPLPSWGSFEGWSAVVRQAVVWCGLPDPFLTRECLLETADVEAGTLAAFIAGWEDLADDLRDDDLPEAITTGDLLRRLDDHPLRYGDLRAAVDDMAGGRGKITAKGLGRRLVHFRGRVMDGKAIDGRFPRSVPHVLQGSNDAESEGGTERRGRRRTPPSAARPGPSADSGSYAPRRAGLRVGRTPGLAGRPGG